ncbi:MAG: pseudouridine synthase [Crenarchaeota archaeon]|nr:pseudouridine synthase [Thermoproteota archaeon]
MSILPREIHLETVMGKLSYLYGRNIIKYLKENIDKVRLRFTSTGRVRDLLIEDKLYFTLRMNDGYLLPTINSAQHIETYVTVSDDAVPFVSSGRSVIAKSIINVSGEPYPGEEISVKDRSGKVLAVGRLLLSPDEIRSVKRGIAVKVRDHVK